MDIGIIVDVSGSVTPSKFLTQQAFLRGLGKTLDIDPEGTHVGMVVFSDKAFMHQAFKVRKHLIFSKCITGGAGASTNIVLFAVLSGFDSYGWNGKIKNFDIVALMRLSGYLSADYNRLSRCATRSNIDGITAVWGNFI